jgi:putative tryptophan/tyrosine transport system substrate-binding protein
VGSGFVESLPRPGGNITGFVPWEPTMTSRWLELLTEIAPSVKRVAVMFNPDTAPYVKLFFLPSLEKGARLFKVEATVTPVHSDSEIETVITSLRSEPGGGLIVMPDTFTDVHRALIISLAAQNNIPAVYSYTYFPKDGGLLSYGPVVEDIFRRSASYVDRVLRGEKPADLPVQLPIKFVTVLNTKTAKALGLAIPQSILLRADEQIE